jgi:hypothetical protein
MLHNTSSHPMADVDATDIIFIKYLFINILCLIHTYKLLGEIMF